MQKLWPAQRYGGRTSLEFPRSQIRDLGNCKNAICGLWQGSADVGVSGALREGGVDDEDHIILGLEAGDDGPVGGFVSDRLLVDLGDDGSFAEVDLVGERAGAHAGDDDALRDSGLLCDGGRDGGDGDAELALSGVGLLRIVVFLFVVSGEIGVGLGTITDGHVGGALLAVAEVTDLDGGAYLADGDVVDEVIAILNLATVE